MQNRIDEFWGKARPETGMPNGTHPLAAHCLDVAAVAVLLSDRGAESLDPRMLGFLVALHDIGKFSRPFQAQSEKNWPVSWLGPFPRERPPVGPRHDAAGFHYLSRVFADRWVALLPGDTGWTTPNRDRIWRALAGHHGRPAEDLERVSEKIVCAPCRDAAGQFVDAMFNVFQPPPWPRPPTERDVTVLSWRLAGLTTLADWIGSRQEWFPYVPADAVGAPGAYFWGHALPHAAAALAVAGLVGARPSAFAGIRGLFPRIEEPTPVQLWAETVPLPDGPVLAVIEDLTGSGKTEAAVTLAHRLLAGGKAQGVYVALPTMATANAMYGRLAEAYQGLFAADARPSLALAHGHASLDPRFTAAIDAGPRASVQTSPHDPADEPAESHCAAWLAHDLRRALLAQVGVGTLDQALLAILPVRHAPLRLRGLTGKVLIVDEVHAFDPYMAKELVVLLEFHAALGGSAVLLSATLPRKSRQTLVDAFMRGLKAPSQALERTEYPLATLVGAGGSTETHCGVREGLPRTVMVTRLPDVAAAVARIAAAHAAGAAVVWVRNTVDDAIAATLALRAEGLEPMLFHARFGMGDRLKIEEEVLRLFGPKSSGCRRNSVLVATQVVEQSLDLDFDLMVTDLAPADLLIQRAGRLWRHHRGVRGVPGPELLIVSPEPVDDPASDWIKSFLPGTSAVYADHGLLWRSAREVFRRGAIVTPDDMRPVIEAAFKRDADGAVPPGLAAASDKAEGEAWAHASIAGSNVLDFQKGYSLDAGLWEPETKTPTRLENEPHVTLRLARERGGSVVPYASRDQDIRRAWALSEVSVAQRRIASCPVPPALQGAADAARAGWGRWERESEMVLLALLVPDGDGYTLAACAKSGAAVAVRYDARDGLSWAGD